MSTLGKAALIFLAILYVVSPVDLCPGPIDDLIIIILTFSANTKRKQISEQR